MAEPAKKSKQMTKTLDVLFDRTNKIKSNKCVFCGKDATEFTDELSRKEYTISGLCQKCQNEVFKNG